MAITVQIKRYILMALLVLIILIVKNNGINSNNDN